MNALEMTTKYYEKRCDEFNNILTRLRDKMLCDATECRELLSVINERLPGDGNMLASWLRACLCKSIDVQMYEDVLVKLREGLGETMPEDLGHELVRMRDDEYTIFDRLTFCRKCLAMEDDLDKPCSGEPVWQSCPHNWEEIGGAVSEEYMEKSYRCSYCGHEMTESVPRTDGCAFQDGSSDPK